MSKYSAFNVLSIATTLLVGCSTTFHPYSPAGGGGYADGGNGGGSGNGGGGTPASMPVATGDFVVEGNGSIIGTIFETYPSLQLLDNSGVIWSIVNLTTANIAPLYDSTTMPLGYTSTDCSGTPYAPYILLITDNNNGLTIGNDKGVYIAGTTGTSGVGISSYPSSTDYLGSVYTDDQCVPNIDGNTNSTFTDFEAGSFNLVATGLPNFIAPLSTISQ